MTRIFATVISKNKLFVLTIAKTNLGNIADSIMKKEKTNQRDLQTVVSWRLLASHCDATSCLRAVGNSPSHLCLCIVLSLVVRHVVIRMNAWVERQTEWRSRVTQEWVRRETRCMNDSADETLNERVRWRVEWMSRVTCDWITSHIAIMLTRDEVDAWGQTV